MSVNPARIRNVCAAVAIAAGTAISGLPGGFAPAAAASVTLPPAHASFDYQIGGAYTPPSGVKVVSRDRTASPAAGLYNICYVNAFQVQPGEQGDWAADLLLRDASGKVIIDKDWNEALLDLRTADKRQRVANKVNGWIDGCASKGFQAIEPDNYDSYDRSKNLITTANAEAYITLLSQHAHSKGLAIAQKNTADLAKDRAKTGLDFSIAEECGQYDECDAFAGPFNNNVIVIEYTSGGLKKACAAWAGKLSIVRRDVDVTTPGSSGYVRQTC